MKLNQAAPYDMQNTQATTLAPSDGFVAHANASARAQPLAPLIVFAVAFALRAAAIVHWQFNGLYGQDAYAYYDYALALRAALLTAQPIPNFWWPPAYPAFLVLVSTFMGATPFAGQFVSLMAGSLLVMCTYLTAREAARLVGVPSSRANPIGWIAALWLAFSTELAQTSIVVMADALGLAFAVCSAWLLLRYARTNSARWIYVSAALLAFAFLARIQLALLIIPWAAFALAHGRRAHNERRLTTAARDWLIAGLIGMAIVAPYLLWVWQSAQSGIPSYAADPGFAQWSPLNFFRRDFVTPDGHLQFPYPSGIYYAVAAVRGGALTPLVIPFVALGIWELWQRRALTVLLFLLGWCAAIYFFIAGMPWQNLRFAFPFFAPLAIMAAFGLSALQTLPRAFARRAIALTMALLIITQLTFGYVELNKFMTTVHNYQDVAQWLKRELPIDATIITFSITLTLAHETTFKVIEIYFEKPETLSALLNGDHQYLLLDMQSVATQWAGRPPALNYEFLRDRVGLEEIGTRLSYTLYRIKR